MSYYVIRERPRSASSTEDLLAGPDGSTAVFFRRPDALSHARRVSFLEHRDLYVVPTSRVPRFLQHQVPAQYRAGRV